jgi:hypothetical protein
MDGSVNVLQLLQQLGFPIFVAVWFMWRLEKKLDRYQHVVNKLLIVNTVIAKTLSAKMDIDDVLNHEEDD